MRELERKQKIKRRLYSKPALIVLALVVIFMIKGAWGVLEKKSDSRLHVKELEAEKQMLLERKGGLEKGIGSLETEEGIRKEIKEKFSVSEEGEYVAVLVEQSNISTTTEDSSKSWFRRLWNVIIGR